MLGYRRLSYKRIVKQLNGTSPRMRSKYHYDEIDNRNNENSPILCERPRIILRKDFYRIYQQSEGFAYIDINGNEKVNANDNLTYNQLYNILNPRNIYKDVNTIINLCFFYFGKGKRLEPIYYLTPCGHCDFCKAQKAQIMSFRAAAETRYSPCAPLFITLTYKNKFIPNEGLRYRDVQLFFRRIRINLERKGYPSDLRYIAVGEYGSNTHRAHYHMILYNFPLGKFGLVEGFDFIERCWSTYVLDDNNKRVTIKTGDSWKYQTERLGMIKVLPVSQSKGCISYVTKYMSKGSYIPQGKTNTFCRTSINFGAKYILENKDYIMNNPSIKILEVGDRFNRNMITSAPISGYIKNKLFPTASVVCPKKEYDEIQNYIVTYYDLKAASLAINKKLDDRFHTLYNDLKAFDLQQLKDTDLIGYYKDEQDTELAYEFLLEDLSHRYEIIKDYPINDYIDKLDESNNWKEAHKISLEEVGGKSYNLKHLREVREDREFSNKMREIAKYRL